MHHSASAQLSRGISPPPTGVLREPLHSKEDGMNRMKLLNIFFLIGICNAQIITTVAGSGGEGAGDNGSATAAQLMQPAGIAIDNAGNLYIADLQDQRVRKVNALGIITTLAGTGTRGFSGDGGAAASATL